MIISLEGLPGKIKVLLDRLTADRAAGLDFLTSISSWSSATNAKVPDNAYYTNALGTKLSSWAPEGSKCNMYTVTGTISFVVPVGVTLLWVTLQGAGGSGGKGGPYYDYQGSSVYCGGGGGGGGELLYRWPYQATAGATITGTVGAGGSIITSTTVNGQNGQSTVFGNLMASGGEGGKVANGLYPSSARGGNGGGIYGAAGNLSTAGSRGHVPSWDPNYPDTIVGRNSTTLDLWCVETIFGGSSGGSGGDHYWNNNNERGGDAGLYSGGASSGDNQQGGGGAASWFGNGGAGTTSSNGGTAGGYGAGGGGTLSGNSGAGGDGFIRIEWIGVSA